MTQTNKRRRDPGNKLPGGMGCLAILLLSVLVIAALSVAVGFSNASPDDRSMSATMQGEAATERASAATEVVLLPASEGSSTMEEVALAPPPATATATPSLSAATKDDLTPSPTSKPSETPTSAPTETFKPTEATFTRPAATQLPPPLPTPKDSYSWTLKVPILMYHYISEPPEDADKYRRDLSVSPKDFQEQMDFLAENGFETIDLYDLSLAITDKMELPPKPVIITLDDGYRDNYRNAYPILKELGFKATFFLVTEFIDQDNELYMDWSMVEEMAANGQRFEPHSKTHPDLTLQDRDFIIWEVQGSRETIAAHVDYLPRYFAYPSGRFNEEVQQILAELDFWGAVTTLGGVWNGFNDRYEWTRMRVRDVTTLADFIAIVE